MLNVGFMASLIRPVFIDEMIKKNLIKSKLMILRIYLKHFQ